MKTNYVILLCLVILIASSCVENFSEEIETKEDKSEVVVDSDINLIGAIVINVEDESSL